jgi:hypothetical protein
MVTIISPLALSWGYIPGSSKDEIVELAILAQLKLARNSRPFPTPI